MIKLMVFSFFCFMSAMSLGSPVRIEAIGASPKGQYVAIEEYGFNQGLNTFYSRIRLMNLWKNQDAAPLIEIEKKARHPDDLIRIREEARLQATQQLEKYNIVTSD
jgi:predicted secreted protein